jgi:hypothetical protein
MIRIHAATLIQKRYRGRLDREIANRRKYNKWYVEKFIPGVTLTQSVVRMRLAKRRFAMIKRDNMAALVLQMSYRCYRSRVKYDELKSRELLRLKGVKATRIQTMIRGMIARKHFRKELYKVVGKRIFAAKVILRAWVNFCNRRRFTTIMNDYRLKYHAQKLAKYKKTREEIIKDLQEIKLDIEQADIMITKTRNRCTALDVFIVEANMRLPVIEKEMGVMTVEDIGNGWGEAFGLEYEELLQQTAMAREELRLRRVQLKTALEEKVDLQLEMEDTELELDRVSLVEVESIEFLRQLEITQIETKVKRIKDRKVRIEACRWKIRSNRTNVIKRERNLHKGLAEKVFNEMKCNLSRTDSKYFIVGTRETRLGIRYYSVI